MAHQKLIFSMPARADLAFDAFHYHHWRRQWDSLVSHTQVQHGAPCPSVGAISENTGAGALRALSMRTQFVSYHRPTLAAAMGAAAFIARARVAPLRNTGAALSPMNAWQIMLGLETLALRMERHCQNAQAVAEYLQSHQQVAWVKYAGYIDRQQVEIGQMKKLEHTLIPEDFSYQDISGLSNEIVQKLQKVRPTTLAQASRISGVTPAAVQLLAMMIKKTKKSREILSQ